jgi:hypothetical protein
MSAYGRQATEKKTCPEILVVPITNLASPLLARAYDRTLIDNAHYLQLLTQLLISFSQSALVTEMIFHLTN